MVGDVHVIQVTHLTAANDGFLGIVQIILAAPLSLGDMHDQ